ncbi:uncharacterized protein CIMG_12964 [Coccidioides immitis RS]|uniref:Uncharacterized protein n=1 Tax=Coccidioides immitis (strain RS) TaxID=246410 RepID=A0A0D8JVX1_COCIM|nr:uncharacterized protein CIMG_12964 [Coccidioides immitis RS]KJF60428.1 hypothetical protein CIMG_12964 [Coccidioides immitis RS]
MAFAYLALLLRAKGKRIREGQGLDVPDKNETRKIEVKKITGKHGIRGALASHVIQTSREMVTVAFTQYPQRLVFVSSPKNGGQLVEEAGMDGGGPSEKISSGGSNRAWDSQPRKAEIVGSSISSNPLQHSQKNPSTTTGHGESPIRNRKQAMYSRGQFQMTTTSRDPK